MTPLTMPDPQTTYPWIPWGRVSSQVDKMWDPENAAHHSIIGLTGSGKSYLAINGILGLCKYDRVLIIDTKGDDPTTNTTGRLVRNLPKHTWYSAMGRRQDGPREKWYRLVVPDSLVAARDVVGEALNNAYDEGEWVIYIDECWDVTGNNPEVGLRLEGIVSKIWRKGRSRHVSLVAATQTPVAVPRLFYDQASFAWIGRIRDKDRQRRLLEIGGLDSRDLPVIADLKRREWFLAADNGEYFARTVVDV